MTEDITEDDVLDALSEDEAVGADEIARELHRGEVRCPNCHRKTASYEKTESEVRDALLTLVDHNRVTTTADWNYRLARREDR